MSDSWTWIQETDLGVDWQADKTPLSTVYHTMSIESSDVIQLQTTISVVKSNWNGYLIDR